MKIAKAGLKKGDKHAAVNRVKEEIEDGRLADRWKRANAEADVRQVPPLAAFRFQFDAEDALRQLKEKAQQEAHAAAAVAEASHRASRAMQCPAGLRRCMALQR